MDKEQILKVNELFYKALGTRDLKLMKTLWILDERAGCVHPGWTILRSWENIYQSWENIFDPEDQVDINLTKINININNNRAWLTCVQEMVYLKRDLSMFNLSQSTNIFEKIGDKWLMVLHHASPIPVNNYKVVDNSLQ
jgi:hypothetical protein